MPFPYDWPIIWGSLPSLQVAIAATIPELEKGSPVISQRIGERSTASFTIVDRPGTATYTKGQKVEIYDPTDTLIFGGVIDNPETTRIAPSGELLHPIRCADWHYLADKRLVAESYENRTCGYIVDDIFDNYLAAEGVTIGLIELGPELVEAVFNYVSVADAFDALAEKAGKVWFIDENKALYFQDRDVTAAPWTATGANLNKRSTRLSGANPFYRNRQYIRGGRGTTDSQVETFTGDAVQVAFTVGYPFESVPTVTVDGAGQTVGIKGINDANDCYWNKGDATLTFDSGSIPPNGDAVVITYVGQFDILTFIEDADEVAAQLAIEGAGTGYNEDISDEPSLNDIDASFDSAQAKLARYGVIRSSLKFTTTRTGLKPGQLLTVDYSAFGLSSVEMLIEAVRIRGNGQLITYEIVAILGADIGSWTRFFKALSAMKTEIIERLDVGSNPILIILAATSESWEITEAVVENVYACSLVGGATPVVGSFTVC